MRSEKNREARLRKLAARNVEVFRKARRPFWEGGMRVVYVLVNDHNFVIGYWDDLDTAEDDMAARYSLAPV